MIELKRISQKTMTKGKSRKSVSLQPAISWSSFVDASTNPGQGCHGVPGSAVPKVEPVCLGKSDVIICTHLHFGMPLHGGHYRDSTREANST